MRRRGPGYAVLGACVLTAAPLAGQTVLTGTVREDSTGRPLSGVEVLIVGTDRRAVTDGAGRFVLSSLPSGRRTALFRSVGYLPVQMRLLLGETDTVWANPAMIARTIQLEPLVTTAEPKAPRGIGREAFEERRKLGFGKFIDSTDLRRSEHLGAADILRRVPGMSVLAVGPRIHYAVSGRRTGLTGEPCFMQIVLDGVIVFRSVAPSTMGRPVLDTPAPPRLEDFDLSSIESIEVYRGAAEVPVEFGGSGAACGAIVLWTRRG